MKKILVFLNLVILLTLFSWSVYKEESYQKMNTFYFATSPVDPRSLMQGDYMVLNYRVTDTALQFLRKDDKDMRKGYIRIKLNARKEAEFIRIDKKLLPSVDNEISIAFTRNYDGIDIGVNSFMFQEGEGNKYSRAAYGEVILLKNGKLRLKNLTDENFKVLK